MWGLRSTQRAKWKIILRYTQRHQVNAFWAYFKWSLETRLHKHLWKFAHRGCKCAARPSARIERARLFFGRQDDKADMKSNTFGVPVGRVWYFPGNLFRCAAPHKLTCLLTRKWSERIVFFLKVWFWKMRLLGSAEIMKSENLFFIYAHISFK